jgi:hypothetical protein
MSLRVYVGPCVGGRRRFLAPIPRCMVRIMAQGADVGVVGPPPALGPARLVIVTEVIEQSGSG